MMVGHQNTRTGNVKWTMPIEESEIDQLQVAVRSNDSDEREEKIESIVEKSIFSKQNHQGSQYPGFQTLNKSFKCNHCSKSYTRFFAMHQHQKKCPLGARARILQNVRKALKVSKALVGKQSFNCHHCGRSFCYRDTLVQHLRYCQLWNGKGDGNRNCTDQKKRDGMPVGQGHLGSKGMLVLLAPSLQTQGRDGTGNQKKAAHGDWAIMSLSSILPRKVTCECGEGFTCPRLLFQHLRFHAQESYICSDCGESMPSWPVFEAHLREQQCKVCKNCNQTFSQRASLVEHLKRNRCPGKVMEKEKNSCPHCKLEYPDTLSLKQHLQGPPCKISHTLIQCPVCPCAFNGVEGLQKHLISHSNLKAFCCQLCQRRYPSLKSLKDHQRKVHHTMKKRFGLGRVGGMTP